MGSLGSIFCGSRHNSDRHVCGRYRERAVALVSALAMTAKHCDPQEKGESMAIDAEIEAAVVAMRAVRVKGAKIHEEVMRAYARAAVEAAERARQEDFQRRAQLNNKTTAVAPGPTENEPTAEGARS